MSYKSGGTTSRMSPEFSRVVNSILHANKDLSIEEQDLKDYIRLIIAIAKPYVRPVRVELEDLIAAGVTGLLKARRDFDPSRSSKFKTFASICILGEIYSYCQANNSLVSIPTHISKASNYVGKMYKLVKAFAKGDPPEETINSIVLEEDSELAKQYLAPSLVDKLQYSKDRVKSIAKNSNLSYEELAVLAKRSLVSIISDTALVGHLGGQAWGVSAERKAGENELQRMLLESLGEKRFMVVELHYRGYSNPEIAQMLHEKGYSNAKGQPISRSAVKSLIDNAVAAIQKMELFNRGADF